MTYKIWIKYQLNENGTIPSFVLDGGYFPIENSEFRFGVADAEAKFAEDVEIFSDEQMEAHIRSLDLKKEMPNDPETLISLTSEELDVIIKEFIQIKQG